jgi:hypothetical protein
MIRISLSYIFELAAKLEPLERLPSQDTPFLNVWQALFMAQSTLDELYNATPYAPFMRSSATVAADLLGSLRKETLNQDFNRQINRFTFLSIQTQYHRYKIVLQADLSVLNAYFVTQKGGFDTVSLLAFGENLFPFELSQKVPEALFDAREAGKCLAYELPTACGFHVFRATESVLRKYYAQVAQSKALPKIRSIGVYLKRMATAKVGDEKIIFALGQMADLYRNPLIHPDAVLTQEEAIGVFGLARSAIAGMLAALPIIPPTTSTALASQPVSVQTSAPP